MIILAIKCLFHAKLCWLSWSVSNILWRFRRFFELRYLQYAYHNLTKMEYGTNRIRNLCSAPQITPMQDLSEIFLRDFRGLGCSIALTIRLFNIRYAADPGMCKLDTTKLLTLTYLGESLLAVFKWVLFNMRVRGMQQGKWRDLPTRFYGEFVGFCQNTRENSIIHSGCRDRAALLRTIARNATAIFRGHIK